MSCASSHEIGLFNLMRHLAAAVLVLLALALVPVPGEAQMVWRSAPMYYYSASVERERPRFAFATDPASTLILLPPFYLAELPEGAEEIRIWTGFGIGIPDLLLRVTKSAEGVDGELVYWWGLMTHPAQDSVFTSFYSAMQRLAGRTGCKEGQVGGATWVEERDGEEIKRRRWTFACKMDFGSNELDWSTVRERLLELRVHDLPDPRTLVPQEGSSCWMV